MTGKSSVRNFPRRPRVIALATFVLFAIAATGYLAQAREGASQPLLTRLAVPPGLIDDEWTGGPRECDLPNGISTACVFMD